MSEMTLDKDVVSTPAGEDLGRPELGDLVVGQWFMSR